MSRFLAVAAVLLATALVWPVPARAGDVPPLDALVGRISMSLGGTEGGAAALQKASSFDLVFRRTIKESHSRDEVTADHRYLWLDRGKRRRLDIRMVDGEGKDSASVITPKEAWLLVDGGAHAVDVEAATAQLTEFDPLRLYSVPFALGAEGRQILGAASLSAAEKDGDRFVLIGRDEEGAETSRIEVDARTYHPLVVQFHSSSGQVEYRYGDYRELVDGLLVPFEREFWRNGTRISRTEVSRFRLKEPQDVSNLFDRTRSKLAALPDVEPIKKAP
jgi:hypothetical protein